MLCSGLYTVDCACSHGVADVRWRGEVVEWIRDCVCCFAQVAPALGLRVESQTLQGFLGEVLVLRNAADVLKKEKMRNVMQSSAAWPMKAWIVGGCENGCRCINCIQSGGLGSSHDWSRRLGIDQCCWQCTVRPVRRLSTLL
jgi:hypothetical protein